MKVAVAMSGGVDSSVAAALLKAQGCEVSGVLMKTWDGEATPAGTVRHGCYDAGEAEDIEDARKVAEALGIDFYVFDLRREYKAEVLDYFCREYLSGRTPNPCVRCNRRVKFEALPGRAEEQGIEFDYFATGHYAQVEYDRGRRRYLLRKAKDLSRDQSYFVSSLSQEQLGRSLFPVGGYTKEEVRRMASDFGLRVNNKPDSHDFVAGGYSSLVGAAQPGSILDRRGNILGEHRGIQFYTVGQRKRLGISASKPLYVTGIDTAQNAVIVGDKEDVYRDELIASDLNWIGIEALTGPADVRARIRNLHQEAEATVVPLGEDKVHVKFREPQMAITPGQAVVFYREDEVVGAGTIQEAGD